MVAARPSRAPSLFISHGAGPFPVLDPDWSHFRDVVRAHGTKLEGVKGILLFTAHWETDVPHITATDDPGLYYDYADTESTRDICPPEAYEIKYPARGDSKLAADIAQHLRQSGWDAVLDSKRGLDHGVFVPMLLLRPGADIPIVQMSILKATNEQDATEKNLKLGRAVEHFRDAGYAIVGSGGSFHEFRASKHTMMTGEPLPPGPEKFEAFLQSAASVANPDERERILRRWREEPSSYTSHVVGESEHFMPFLVTAATGGNNAGMRTELIDRATGPMSFFEW